MNEKENLSIKLNKTQYWVNRQLLSFQYTENQNLKRSFQAFSSTILLFKFTEYVNYIDLARPWYPEDYIGHMATIPGLGIYTDDKAELSKHLMYITSPVITNYQVRNE